MNKKAFILYTEQQEIFNQLTDSQAGKLIKTIYDYENNGTLKNLDPLLKMAFVSIKQSLDRNREKYIKISEMRSNAGAKGGIAKANKTKQKLAKASKPNNSHVNDNVNVNGNDNDNVNVNDIKHILPDAEKKQLYINDINKIFEHWKSIMNYKRAKLDGKRKDLIRKALKTGYSEAELCLAITGCSYTPHNMGKNDRGERFDGLHIIFKDAEHIDRFINNYNNPPEGNNHALKPGTRAATYAALKNFTKESDEDRRVAGW